MLVTQAQAAIPDRASCQRIVIAGGPGSGKSTLLQALGDAGEICFPEVSRDLIREQVAQGGNLLPWINLEGFARQCTARMLAQIAQSAHHPRAFFDRGLPDVIGYLRHAGLQPPPELRIASAAYSPSVFFAPSWLKIYVNDPERPQTYAQSEALSAHIRMAYADCGFRIIDLVKASVADRVLQIRQHLDRRDQAAEYKDHRRP